MLSAPLLALTLAAQAAGIVRESGFGSTITARRSFVGADLATLDELVRLTFHDDGPAAKREADVRSLVAKGRAVRLDAPSRVRVNCTLDANYLDFETGRKFPVYWGILLDGPATGRHVFDLASQVLPDDAVDRAIATGRLDDESRAIYRLARSSMIAARNRAGRLDIGIRKRAMQQGVDEALRTFAKKNGLDLAEAAEIVRIGEIEDGAAERRAKVNSPARLAARARNEMMLGEIDRQIGIGMAQVMRVAAYQAAARDRMNRSMMVVLPPFRPSAILMGPLGHPMDRFVWYDDGASVAPFPPPQTLPFPRRTK